IRHIIFSRDWSSDVCSPDLIKHQLPTHLSLAQFQRLPESTGIYVFRNKKGKIIYVGKAVNIKKRVLSHFEGISSSLRRQQFINDIATRSEERRVGKEDISRSET